VLQLSWLLLVASLALSTLLQVTDAPPTLVGYLTAGATRVAARELRRAQPALPHPDPAIDPAAEVEDQEPIGG
jgi:hypothetical protein